MRRALAPALLLPALLLAGCAGDDPAPGAGDGADAPDSSGGDGSGSASDPIPMGNVSAPDPASVVPPTVPSLPLDPASVAP